MTTQIELQQYLGRLYGASGIIVRDPGSSTGFREWNGEDTRDLCVTAGEVLDLPGAIETYTHVNLNRRARKLYDQMAMSFHAELESGEKITAANALARLMRFQQLTSGFAHTEDGKVLEVDDSKARALADILEDLPNREPVVVFARFQNDLDAIARVADGAKQPHFEISGRTKDLEEWNKEGGVLAVQIQAGGLGLDLTAARYCVYYSLGFSLGDYLQSIARLHRPGQKGLVDYIHLVAAASVDEIIVDALEAKLDFTHFRRHERGNLRVDDTERPGVPEHQCRLRTVKNLPRPATGGAAPERGRPSLFLNFA